MNVEIVKNCHFPSIKLLKKLPTVIGHFDTKETSTFNYKISCNNKKYNVLFCETPNVTLVTLFDGEMYYVFDSTDLRSEGTKLYLNKHTDLQFITDDVIVWIFLTLRKNHTKLYPSEEEDNYIRNEYVKELGDDSEYNY